MDQLEKSTYVVLSRSGDLLKLLNGIDLSQLRLQELHVCVLGLQQPLAIHHR